MTVFKTFWKVVNKYKATIILFTVMLVTFGGVNTKTGDNTMIFTNTKPDIILINNDNDNVITNNLISYIKENTDVKDAKNDEEARDDALFYREVSYIIYIPKGYGESVKNNKELTIDIKSNNDYYASIAEMVLKRYLDVQRVYSKLATDDKELISMINKNINSEAEVNVVSKLDIATTTKVSRYFNFASYSIMAVVIYVVCLVLSSFHEKNVNKRNIVSSMNYKKQNRLILGSSLLFAFIVWFLYIIISFITFKGEMLNLRGLLYMGNALIFTFTSLTIALLISSLTNNKGALTGIINVVALGSAFLTGAFIPTEWLPTGVLNFAHILPSYWYCNSNDLLSKMEIINLESLKTVYINSLMILLFGVLFIVINNIVVKRKRKI